MEIWSQIVIKIVIYWWLIYHVRNFFITSYWNVFFYQFKNYALSYYLTLFQTFFYVLIAGKYILMSMVLY